MTYREQTMKWDEGNWTKVASFVTSDDDEIRVGDVVRDLRSDEQIVVAAIARDGFNRVLVCGPNSMHNGREIELVSAWRFAPGREQLL